MRIQRQAHQSEKKIKIRRQHRTKQKNLSITEKQTKIFYNKKTDKQNDF